MKNRIDKILIAAIIILSIFGIIMIYSASSIWAEYKFNDSFHYLKYQSVFFLIGIIIMFAGYGAVGSALVWGARGRQFKSGCSDYEMGSRSLQRLPFLLVRGING